jgi:hypothetical protein
LLPEGQWHLCFLPVLLSLLHLFVLFDLLILQSRLHPLGQWNLFHLYFLEHLCFLGDLSFLWILYCLVDQWHLMHQFALPHQLLQFHLLVRQARLLRYHLSDLMGPSHLCLQ